LHFASMHLSACAAGDASPADRRRPRLRASADPCRCPYIGAGERHRLANPGKIPAFLIEVQSGAYLDEDDITRFEDVYYRS